MKRQQHGYLLIEALVYIGVVAALLGVAYAAAYRCIDRSIALRRNANDITSALHAGERWRANVRAATSQVRLESTEAGRFCTSMAPAAPSNIASPLTPYPAVSARPPGCVCCPM